jgi:regulator of cell morphogenesis and NO signaling
MKINRDSSIARVAADVPGATEVFEALGLEYSCAGERSLADAAYAAAIDPDAVVGRLRRLRSVQNAVSWNDRRLTEVMNHLVSEHHRLVAGELRTTALRLADACSSPAGVPPDVHSLRSAFARLSELLLPHIREEEEEIFPIIETLEHAWESGQSHADAHDLHERVGRIVNEHGKTTALLRSMREIRERLQISNDLPSNCQPILEGIAELEAHLHQYMFLENSILFPRAVTLSAQLAQRSPLAVSS